MAWYHESGPKIYYPSVFAEPEAPRRSHVPFMALATLAYLAFELGFNARLLDVTGGSATEADVSAIEQNGRLLSGTAVVLAFWGMAVFPRAMPLQGPRWRPAATLAALVVSAALVLPAVYWLERKLVDHVVDASTGERRRAAAHLAAVSAALLRGGAEITGLELPRERLREPAGKAFLSVFPFAALSTPDLGARTEAMVPQVVRRLAEDQLGGARGHYNDVFLHFAKELTDVYNKYADGSDRYAAALDGIPARQAQAWSDYARDLHARTGRAPEALPRAYWNEAASSVRSKGIQVPAGWAAGDRAGFEQAVAARIRQEASGAFRSASSEAAGAALPPNLQLAEFLAHPAIQDRWRRAIGAPAGAALNPRMTFEVYARDVYGPAIDRAVRDRVAVLLKPAASFADGGANVGEGRGAMEALAVPPIALAFSLVGALVHLFKASNYLGAWLLPRMRRRRTVLGVTMAVLVAAPFMLANPVTASPGFRWLEAHTRESLGTFGGPVSAALRWTIQAEPYFYPVNEAVRRFALLGQKFGVGKAGAD